MSSLDGATSMQWSDIRTPISRLAISIAAVAAVVVALSIFHVPQDRLLSAALNLFLVVVLVASIRWGAGYTIFLSFLCAIAFSGLLASMGHFRPWDGRVWTLLGACAVTGLIASRLSDRLRHAVSVADQRRAEAIAGHQRFMDLVNSVEGIVWEADAETLVFSFVSDQAERVLGYPTKRWLNEATFWKDRVHPEDRDYAEQLRLQILTQQRNNEFEYRMIAADGRAVWMRNLVTVVRENGRATRLRGVMIDVTKRKQDQSALLEQANLLSLAHEAILVRDKNRVIRFWNRGAELLYGWTAEQAIGSVPHALLKTVFPASLEQIEAEVSRTGRWEGELTETKKDGTPLVIASRWASQRDERGALVAIHITNNDISERRWAEERLHVAMSERVRLAAFRERIRVALAHEGNLGEVLQSCAEAILGHFDAAFARIWTTNNDQQMLELQASAGMYTHLNGAHSRITVGQRKIGLVAQERKPYLSNDVQNDPQIEDKDWARGEGMVSFAGYPLVVEDRVVGVMGLFSQKALPENASETLAFVADAIAQGIGRKHAEEERERLRQLEVDLEHINRVSMMGELTASLAHELNQPIAAAISNANTCVRWLARNQPNLEEAREAATRMVKDGMRAAEIINGLRSFYRKGAPAQREVVDVNEIVREMTGLLGDEAARCWVSVNLELAEGVPKVIADRVQLQQVLMNLMLNAMEAMQKTGGELTIRSQLGNDGHLLISVRDTGVGLPLEKVEQIFDAFYTTKPHGTGMGLAITRRIIEAHGGRLSAAANPVRGATFQFTLPSQMEAQA